MTAPGAPTREQLHTFAAPTDEQRALFEVAIAPNGEAIARYGMRGEVTVLVQAPDDEMKQLATFLGWDGNAPLFRLSNAKRKSFADRVENIGDPNTARWLRREDQRGDFRLFVISGPATLALDFKRGRGWAVVPTS